MSAFIHTYFPPNRKIFNSVIKERICRIRNQLRHRRHQSDNLPILLIVVQRCGSLAVTDSDYRADVPVFSSEFCPIFLGLMQMQLCVTERCHGTESPLKSSDLCSKCCAPQYRVRCVIMILVERRCTDCTNK